MKRLAVLLSVLVLAGCPATSPMSSTDSGTSTDKSSGSSDATAGGEKVTFSTANAIIQQRCVSCHAASPSDPVFSSPGGGVKLETAAEIKAKAQRIAARVAAKSMPQGNKTGMTDDERKTIADWFAGGAPTE